MNARALQESPAGPGFRGSFVLTATLLLGAAPHGVDITAVYPCHCANNGYAVSSEVVAIFTGSNELRIRGGGVELATSALVDGIGPLNIVARRPGELDVTLAVPAGLSPGNRTARVKFPIGENTFRVNLIPRGTVGRIEELPASAQVNQVVWVKFSGAELGGARMITHSSPPFTEVTSSATSSFSTYRTQIKFTKCGTFQIAPHRVHHSSAPLKEIQTRNALYLGSPVVNVNVTGCETTGLVCTSMPNIGTPVITAPAGGSTLVFGSGTSSPTSITIRWAATLTPSNQTPPLNEFVVTRNVRTRIGTTVASSVIVKGTSATYSFAIPGTHTVKVRANNCGDGGPEASTTFSTKYQ